MYVSQLDRDNLEAELWEVETAVEEINKILRGEVDIKKIQQKEELIRKRRFERYIELGNSRHPGEIRNIYDERGSLLCKDL